MINNKETKKDARVALIFAVKSSGLTKDSSKMACEFLTEQRKEKVDKKHFIGDKNNCIAAGLLLNYAVSYYVQLSKENSDTKNNQVIANDVMLDNGKQEINIIYVTIDELINSYDKSYNYKIANKENGKPYFVEHRDIYFNLSHSGEYAVCVIGNTENGIDIEGKRENVLKTARRFFSENEYNWVVEGVNDKDKLTRFLRLWTLKESYSKVTGKGIAYGIKEALFTIDGERINFLDVEKEKKYRIYQSFINEYVITVILLL